MDGHEKENEEGLMNTSVFLTGVVILFEDFVKYNIRPTLTIFLFRQSLKQCMHRLLFAQPPIVPRVRHVGDARNFFDYPEQNWQKWYDLAEVSFFRSVFRFIPLPSPKQRANKRNNSLAKHHNALLGISLAGLSVLYG
jgi:hypothetical protein